MLALNLVFSLTIAVIKENTTNSLVNRERNRVMREK
jgi:hypothetical protein